MKGISTYFLWEGNVPSPVLTWGPPGTQHTLMKPSFHGHWRGGGGGMAGLSPEKQANHTFGIVSYMCYFVCYFCIMIWWWIHGLKWGFFGQKKKERKKLANQHWRWWDRCHSRGVSNPLQGCRGKQMALSVGASFPMHEASISGTAKLELTYGHVFSLLFLGKRNAHRAL